MDIQMGNTELKAIISSYIKEDMLKLSDDENTIILKSNYKMSLVWCYTLIFCIFLIMLFVTLYSYTKESSVAFLILIFILSVALPCKYFLERILSSKTTVIDLLEKRIYVNVKDEFVLKHKKMLNIFDYENFNCRFSDIIEFSVNYQKMLFHSEDSRMYNIAFQIKTGWKNKIAVSSNRKFAGDLVKFLNSLVKDPT